MTQILGKQKFTAEEVQSQLADRGIPKAVLERAARKAGLLTDNTTLDKLMEQGKLTTDKILKPYAEELRNLANNNDALNKALRQNFAPALGRATNSLKDFSNAMFQGGLKDGLMFVLNSFADLANESKGLAHVLGSVLGGAIKLTSSILGAVAGAYALAKVFKMIGKSAKFIRSASKSIGGMFGGNKAAKVVKNTAKSGAMRTAAAATTGALGATSAMVAKRLVPPVALALKPSEVASGTIPEYYSNPNEQTPMEALRDLKASFAGGSTVNVNLTMDKNLKEIVDARVATGLQSEFDGMTDTLGSSKD
jgi:tape measure domain-containing protein